MTAQRATRSFPATDSPLSLARGRAAHNARRRALAEQRRVRLVELFKEANCRQRGWQSAIAKELGCHRATVSRDLAAIRADFRAYRRRVSDDHQAAVQHCQNWLHQQIENQDRDE